MMRILLNYDMHTFNKMYNEESPVKNSYRLSLSGQNNQKSRRELDSSAARFYVQKQLFDVRISDVTNLLASTTLNA